MADRPLQYMKGVGPRRAEMLAKGGIRTAADLLLYAPFRYEDRTGFVRISELVAGQAAVIAGRILAAGSFRTPRKGVRIFEMRIGDDSGSLPVKFFNQPYLERTLRKDRQVILYGVPQPDGYSLGLSLINPEYELVEDGEDGAVHTGRIVPVYRKIGQMQTKALRTLIHRVLETVSESDFPETMPSEVRARHQMPSRIEAIRQIHFPEAPPDRLPADFLEDLEARRTPAQRRMIFEEFFLFQKGLRAVKVRRQTALKKRKIEVGQRTREVLKSILPFHPTGAQKRTLKEIVDDLTSPKVMNRLLQGDVGSGKTIVALQAMIVVMESGFQCVLMAPTEILAEQHFETLRRRLEGTGYRIAFLTGAVRGVDRNTALAQIQEGEADVVVGTHAVFQKGVKFARLGFVVIDEQHRFGVLQRSRLMEKGERPDTLVMTATPIPRSLALTLYGDLDLSVLDELPPGRRPVQTLIKSERHRTQVYEGLRRQLQEGRQVYVVYPLVEESEKLDLKAAREMSEKLQKEVFPEFRVGLIHGRLKAKEKDGLMRSFKKGEVHVLVATTVVEVGIDVPNASLMVIEHADRFGLSQLHQLRGRVGRGSHESFCILMFDDEPSSNAVERLQVMRESNDGFKIAEKDLELRGPGEFGGTRQWGLPGFCFGNIIRDRRILELARREADLHLEAILAKNLPPSELMAVLTEDWNRSLAFLQVG